MGLLQSTSNPSKPAYTEYTPLTDTKEYPVPIYQFAIEIKANDDPDNPSPDVIVALFQNISGIEVKRDVEPLTEGGVNNYAYEFPGHISYEHITFEVGLTSSSFFWDWMVKGQHDGRAEAKNFTLVQRRPNPDFNESDDGSEIFVEVRRWDFKNAYPVSWKISDLSLDDSEKIVIESLELSYDYFLAGTIVPKTK